MLHVSVHAGRLDQISRFNRTDWLDIGYEKLAEEATYKILLFNVDEGARDPVYLRDYPRWSASLWDLVARSIALARSPLLDKVEEVVPEIVPGGKRCAFARAVSVVIEHHPTRGMPGRRLGAMEILQHKRVRGLYRATVEEDLQPPRSTVPFLHRPSFLYPVELVLQAALWRLGTDGTTLPPRPPLYLPNTMLYDGLPYVVIHKIMEPARTGFLRWLRRESEPPVPYWNARDGIAPEASFQKFRQVAV